MTKTYKAQLVPMEDSYIRLDYPFIDNNGKVHIASYEHGYIPKWQAQRLIILNEHGTPIATYPNMPDTYCIDIADVRKWIDNGCSESVELEVYGNILITPRIEDYTVKMVWDEVDNIAESKPQGIDWEQAKLDFGFHAKAVCKNEINATKVIEWIKQYYQFPFKNNIK